MTTSSYVRLDESDSKRLGCPERIAYDLAEITAREQATLQQAFGYHTPADLFEAMRAMVDMELKTLTRDPQAFLALTWLALRQGGHLAARRSDEMAAELADLDIKLAKTLLEVDEDDEGKDDGSTPTGTSTA